MKAVLVLNLLDALFTLAWVGAGQAREANPFLRDLVETRPLVFVAAKLALVGLGSILLWRLRHRPLAIVAIVLAFTVYYGLLVWHVGHLGLVVGRAIAP